MKFLVSLFICFFLFSCGEEKVVVWPSLTKLDNLSVAVEKAAYQHEHAEQKRLLMEAKETISVVSESVPNNAKNMEQAKVILSDLSTLGEEIKDLENLGHDELDGLSKSIHPIVAKLMVTSGVPHVHASSEEDGHDPATCTDPTHNH